MKNLHPLLYGSLFLTLVGALFTFTSCEKDAQVDESLTYSIDNYNRKSTPHFDSYIGFHNLNPKEIAEEHNEILNSVHLIISNDELLDLESAVKLLNINLSSEQRTDVFNWAIENDEEKNHIMICESLTESNSLNLYNEILNEVEISENYESLKANVSNLLKSANEDIKNETDKKLINIYGQTCIASARYWMTEYDGDFIDGESRADIINADGKAAAGASITWAVGAAMASGPVAPLTYFVAVGLGAALGSLMASGGTSTTTGY
jgi:hypothetical protein